MKGILPRPAEDSDRPTTQRNDRMGALLCTEGTHNMTGLWNFPLLQFHGSRRYLCTLNALCISCISDPLVVSRPVRFMRRIAVVRFLFFFFVLFGLIAYVGDSLLSASAVRVGTLVYLPRFLYGKKLRFEARTLPIAGDDTS